MLEYTYNVTKLEMSVNLIFEASKAGGAIEVFESLLFWDQPPLFFSH